MAEISVEADPKDKCLTYEIPEAGALLGLTKSQSYAAAKRGVFGKLIEIGAKRRKVSKVIFHRMYNPPAA